MVTTQTPTPTELARLLEAATPLIECDHRANDPRGERERLVGFVIDQDLIGLGLSEPLFALRALVDLAKATPAHLAAIASLQFENEGLRGALEPFAAKTDLIADDYDEDYRPDWSPFIPVSAYRTARAALQTRKAKP